ncbi:MAG: MBOAT family protein [Undibacterium sp.]|nr:MBOAT family protein [Undibacterium sp.]
MIFSSAQFILLFLPTTLFLYFLLNRLRLVQAGKVWLVAMSLLFYGYWSVAYLPLLLGSISFNFIVGRQLAGTSTPVRTLFSRRFILTTGVVANLALLGYFKYTEFLIGNLVDIFKLPLAIPHILLPLGISFFTFTQIAYLVDSYRRDVKEYDFINFALFVTFFPHLIAGPILHHREMMDQFKSRWTLAVRYRHIVLGLFIFSLGMAKKVIIADTFAIWANEGFDGVAGLDFFAAWGSSLSYTFQLYFDFSGYCDMAMGASLLFNIWLPINFNSPYKALDIQDFWRRWHMTLSRYLRDYLYIPMGGNRCSPMRSYLNLMATFLLGGLWHGASWMFIIWGGLHGLALVIHRIWGRFNLRLPTSLAWLITFLFINITWVFFRAKDLTSARRMLGGMLNLDFLSPLSSASIATSQLAWGGWLSDYLLTCLPLGLAANFRCFLAIVLAFAIIYQKNTMQLMSEGVTAKKLYSALLLLCIAMYATMTTTSAVFLYFNF